MTEPTHDRVRSVLWHRSPPLEPITEERLVALVREACKARRTAGPDEPLDLFVLAVQGPALTPRRSFDSLDCGVLAIGNQLGIAVAATSLLATIPDMGFEPTPAQRAAFERMAAEIQAQLRP